MIEDEGQRCRIREPAAAPSAPRLCDDRDTMAEELSPSEVAARLGTTTRTVQRWIERGTLPARRVGGRWRVANDAIVAFEHGAAVAEERALAERPIRRLFVANRGEIAARIRRTGDRLGLMTIVPPTTGPDRIDLLDIDEVIAASR